jgi:S-adenosylmethionine hydrolase
MLHALRVRLVLCICVLACAGTAVAKPVPRPAVSRPIIVFMTDFGVIDDAVAICKGVMVGIAPEAEIIDLTHQVTPFSISEGARMLGRTTAYYPRGTVFVTVIDPGVGTSRKSIIVKTKRGQYFVLPDNGLVTQVVDRDGVEGIREITNPRWLLPGSSSSTFHGRDVYSPVAAHLAHGEDWRDAGPALATLTRLDVPQARVDGDGVQGLVVALDGPFGNLVTNVGAEVFRGLGYNHGDIVRLKVGAQELSLPFVATFGGVAEGKPLVFIDSRGLLSLAVNQGNFAQTYSVSPPVELTIRRK